MYSCRPLVRLALALGLTLPLPAMAETADDVLASAKSDCQTAGGTSFSADADAVTQIDLTGDGTADQIVDAAKFHCPGADGYWSGTGGAQLWLLVNGKSWPEESLAWEVLDWKGSKVLLLSENGGACGGYGAENCVEALVWDPSAEDFMTVAGGGD